MWQRNCGLKVEQRQGDGVGNEEERQGDDVGNEWQNSDGREEW